MRRVPMLWLSLAALVPTVALGLAFQDRIPLSTGKFISPVGSHVEVGGFPCNMVMSPDGQFLAVTNVGPKQYVTILSAATGQVVDQLPFNGPAKQGSPREGLYFGLAFTARQGGGYSLLVSHGSQQTVTVHPLDATGRFLDGSTVLELGPVAGRKDNLQCSGIAVAEGTTYVANNFISQSTGYRGSVWLLSASGKKSELLLPGYPLDVAAIGGDQPKAYVSCERDGSVAVIDGRAGKLLKTIRTGANATYLRLNKDATRLFVSNSNADTISVVDTRSDRVVQTVLVRPNVARGLPGATPLGICLSPDEKTLYVALADMNAVGVLNLPEGTLRGYIPTAWYPTSVAVSSDGKTLFVASAKGPLERHANPGQYILDVLPGTVTTLPTPSDDQLREMSAQVLDNNRVASIPEVEEASKKLNPGVEHVIYVIKENRTYDQILGDVTRGNGDPALCLFPREVTPNQHALTERFALLDNFYVSGDVSADGWNWSTGGISNEYNQRNTRYNYAGRGRTYDFEGTNNGIPVDLLGLPDVSRPHGGYLWDNAIRHGVSLRNYGAYVYTKSDRDEDEAGNPADKKVLAPRTCADYRQFDMAYADSDAWVKYNSPAAKQRKTYGKHKDACRFDVWKREYDAYVRKGDMPKLMIVRLPNDHTVGTSEGLFSPRAMVADNDYALGKIVETVSNSPYWRKSAIVVVEDDAQAGYDHVDAHRSTCYVVSPFVRPGTYSNTFYNTDSVLRTIEALLGLPPMNSYDAIAMPIQVFGSRPVNDAPYQAILPPKEIICEVNSRTAYRAKDSARLLSLYEEETLPDLELNDILWGSIRGANTPRPKVRLNVILRDR